MYLLFLLWSPVQHMMAQQGSLLLARDIENWQLSVDWGVSCAHFAWFFMGHNRSWGSTLIPCLPTFVWVIPITIIISTPLPALTWAVTSRPACTTTTSCAGTATATCTGTTTTTRSSSSTATTTVCGLLA